MKRDYLGDLGKVANIAKILKITTIQGRVEAEEDGAVASF